MSDTRPSDSTHDPTQPSSGRTPPQRPAGTTIDVTEAARIASAAVTAGRAGLRTAWRKGKATAAAHGVTEESVRQTVAKSRMIAIEQAKRRGLGESGLPRWPGDLSDSPDDRPHAGSAPPGRPAESHRGNGTGTATPSTFTRTVAASALSRVPSMAGRRRFGVFPAAATDSAPIERRLGAFALDLVVFGAAFVVFAVAADILLGAAFGSGGSGGGDVLGVPFLDLLRVVAFLELGKVATASASAAVTAIQVLHLVGFAAYMIGLEARLGATVGKQALGLRVVTKLRGHGRIGLQRAAIRNACRLYDILIPLWPLALLDLAVTLLSPRRQRSGDWFAGTVVVDERPMDCRAGSGVSTSVPDN